MSNVTTLGPLIDTVDSNDTLDLSDKIINFVVQTRPTVNTITNITQAISRATPSLGAAVAGSDQSGGANPAIYAPICVVVLLVAVGTAFYGKKKMNENNERRDSRNDENRNSRGLKVIPKSSKADFDESTAVYECMDSRSNMSLAQSMSFGGSKHTLNPHIDSISLHQSNSQMSLNTPRHNGGGKKAPAMSLSNAKIEEERSREDELKSKSSLQVVNEIKPKKNLSDEKTNINKALSNEEVKDLLQKIESSSHIVQEANASKDKQKEEEEEIPMPESQIEISVSPPPVVAAEENDAPQAADEPKPNADEENN